MGCASTKQASPRDSTPEVIGTHKASPQPSQCASPPKSPSVRAPVLIDFMIDRERLSVSPPLTIETPARTDSSTDTDASPQPILMAAEIRSQSEEPPLAEPDEDVEVSFLRYDDPLAANPH
jgi:hypothetical protein